MKEKTTQKPAKPNKNGTDILDMKHNLIDTFPYDSHIIVTNSPITTELSKEIAIFDAIDTIMCQTVGTIIDIKEFSEYMENLSKTLDFMKNSNQKYLDQIAENDEFFVDGKTRMKNGII